ncbi:PH domain-containing protein [Enterococcus asini]|uniref:PH domain-containing protein n=2 Tax=Enterococcus asini TaxID=57732 RepID=UPI0022E863C2|nr:PH domain-containing protein [Enterococcus asini]
MRNPFKKAFWKLNDELGGKQDLSTQDKKRLFEQTKMYIFLQDFLKKLTPYLEEGEVIQAYLPMTNQENTAVATGGIMGMAYAREPEARAYVENFHDVRGNRLLVFTNQRMLFVVIVEFLEERLFYSYPYDSIQSILFKKHKIGYFDWSAATIGAIRKQTHYYTLDFQAGDHIFTEMLAEDDGVIFQRQLETVPALQGILLGEKVQRERKFDLIFSNASLQLKLLYGLSILLVLFLVLYVLLLVLGAFGWGPQKDLFASVCWRGLSGTVLHGMQGGAFFDCFI